MLFRNGCGAKRGAKHGEGGDEYGFFHNDIHIKSVLRFNWLPGKHDCARRGTGFRGLRRGKGDEDARNLKGTGVVLSMPCLNYPHPLVCPRSYVSSGRIPHREAV